MNQSETTAVARTSGGNAILYTDDFERSLEFYRDLLSFEVLYTFPETGTESYATMRLNDFYLGLATYEAVGRTTGLPLPRGTARHFEISVIVEDPDKVAARMRDRGVPVLLGPRDTPWGDRQVYVEDPDGNYVELTTDRW